MKVLVIGAAGLQGSRLAHILGGREWVSRLILADKNVSGCERVASDVGGSEAMTADMDDHAALVSLMRRADVVCKVTGPYFYSEPLGVRAAIEAGRGYVDICDDYMIVDTVSEYDSAAREAGVAAICGAGCSPGLTNIWARQGVDRLDAVDAITIYLLAGAGVWGAAALQHMIAYYDTYDGKIPIVKGGEVELAAPGEEPETTWFPDPAGEQETFLMAHAEPLMLHQNIGLLKGAQDISVKGVLGDGTELIRMILGAVDMGLTKRTPVSLMGQSVAPYDLFVEYLASPAFSGSNFLKRLGAAAERNAWGLELKVLVKGRRGGKPAEVEYRLAGDQREMSIPETAAMAAELLATGAVKQTGVLLPENLDCDAFLDRLRQHVSWEEESR